MQTPLIVNVGCGQTPTQDAVNFDNSFSVRLAGSPLLYRVARALRLASPDSLAFADFCKMHGVRRGDCTRLPLPDETADVVYSSHMVEHLTKKQLAAYLAEAKRVLKPGGVLRTALPDMQLLVAQYESDGDCDALLARMLVVPDGMDTLMKKLRYLFLGWRGHQWMYDADSFGKALAAAGFTDVRALRPGETCIADPGGLDLAERADESAYVECRKA